MFAFYFKCSSSLQLKPTICCFETPNLISSFIFRASGATDDVSTRERNIKQEDGEDGEDDADEEEDEILAELKRKQDELKALTEKNASVATFLIKMARAEMERQEVRRKMDVADNEVTEMYRKLQSMRQRRKQVPKKDVEAVRRAIAEREKLRKQLESLAWNVIDVKRKNKMADAICVITLLECPCCK